MKLILITLLSLSSAAMAADVRVDYSLAEIRAKCDAYMLEDGRFNMLTVPYPMCTEPKALAFYISRNGDRDE
jgi:hypothetical protein